MQEASKMGLMSCSKSTRLVDGGGSFETSMVSAASRRKVERKIKPHKRAKSQIGTARCAVRAAFSGATWDDVFATGFICSARYCAGWDAVARRPYHTGLTRPPRRGVQTSFCEWRGDFSIKEKRLCVGAVNGGV